MKQGGMNLDINSLKEPLRTIVHNAYGDSFGLLFLIAGIIGIAGFLAILAIRDVPLRNTVALKPAAQAADAPADGGPGNAGAAAIAADDRSGGNRNVAAMVDNGRSPAEVGTGRTTDGPLTEPGTDWDPAGLDDPAERVSVAALDVLTAAQDRARAQEALGHAKVKELIGRLDSLSHEVDAAIGGFHRQVQEIREQLLSAEPERHSSAPDGVGGDELRGYEYNLLLDSQQTAERVTRLARAEAERTLAEADQQRAELEKRIEQLRGVERELSNRISDHLRTSTGGDDQQN